MKEWMNKHKMSVFIIMSAVVMLLGLSYAWFKITLRGEKELRLTAAGNLLLILDDSMTDGIAIENAIPITNEEGKLQKGYEFTLENRGNIDSDYTIYLDDLEIESTQQRMKNQYVKYCLTRDGKEIGLDVLSATGEVPNRVIDTGDIAPGEKYRYELKIWIDYNAGNEVMGTVFKGQLRIEGIQKKNGLSKPSMDHNMIAVVYDEGKKSWTKVNETSDTWYNYDFGKWANAVTVSSATRDSYKNAAEGTEVSMNDIETMWVWIPRYSYTIGSEDGENYYGKQGEYLNSKPTKELPGEIDVKFISRGVKDTGSAKYLVSKGVSGWRTPDAFTFGGKELAGIWVGKFETSSSNPAADYGGGNTTDLDAMIKPNVTSWRAIQVANIGEVGFSITKEGNRYGLNGTEIESHAMKNDEWGAVAYLSQSRYGKLRNKSYSGANKEIYQNKSNAYITGCSYGSPSNGNTDYGCQYTYDVSINGTGASTTGTIYGVYDMSGGAWEYVMGNYNRYSGYSSKSYTAEEAAALGRTDGASVGIWNSGYTGMCGFDNLTFTGKNWLDDKYYNFYTTDNVATACNGGECKSHGLSETAGWYSDDTPMVGPQWPWFLRGGDWGDDLIAGSFAFDRYYGDLHGYGSFRLVLSVS